MALDPGEKIGWAHGRIYHDQLEVIDHGIAPLKQFALTLADESSCLTSITAYSVVVYERWRLAAYAAKALIGSDMQSSQFVGMVRLLAWMHDVKLVSQDPKDMVVGAQTAPHSVTSILATLPKSHDDSHDGSALKHLAYYWFKNFYDPTTEAL